MRWWKVWALLLPTLCISLSLSSGTDSPKQSIMKELSNIQFNVKPDNHVIYDKRSDDQDTVDSRLWGGVNLKKAASRIGEHFRDIANDELGVTTLQGVFDSTEYVNEVVDLQSKVSKMGSRLVSKLAAYSQVLNSNRAQVQNLYKFHIRSPIYEDLSCCNLNSSLFSQTDESEGSTNSLVTSLHTTCDLLPSDLNHHSFNPGRNLTLKFSLNIQRHPALKWQYFISSQGVHNEFPAHQMSTADGIHCSRINGYRHREVYVNTVSPQSKSLVVVIDVSSMVTSNQLRTAQELARQAVLSLSTSDKVTVLTLSQTVEAPPTICAADSLSVATEITKYYLCQYIDELTQSRTQANHSLGLTAAFSVIPTGESGIILYISKGLLYSINEPKDVLTAIAAANAQHNGRVVIHTYGLVDDGDVVMYEKMFLQDVASQNFSKYAVEYAGSELIPGSYHTVCCADSAAAALNDLFGTKAIEINQSQLAIFSRPYNDIVDKGLMISMTVPCISEDAGTSTLIGVVGIDLALEDLTDRITHTNSEGLYAFLVNAEGYVIMHPSMERSMSDRNPFTLISLSHYENLPGFDSIVDKILATSEGTAELQVANSTMGGDGVVTPCSITYVYSWYKVDITPYIVVMRGLKSKDPTHKISDVSAPDPEGMVYHRLDLGQLPSEHTCLHFKQLASFSTSALFLSAKAFEEPYEHGMKPETKKIVANYLAYITDSSSYISKPGLKEGVRNDVIATSHIDKLWRQQGKSSAYKDFIVRRYVATPSGALRMFPATLTHKMYDPARTHWYKQATRLPGRIILTRPSLDVAGSGYTVTLGHSVYEGRSAALHTPRDPIAAVMGADFSASYFQRLLLDLIPMCEASAIRCFILDDQGYIITHPDLKLSAYHRTVEQQHLTHMEPLVANDILGHKSLVSKKQCNSFSDRTVQRYYDFNTALTGTLTNLKAGEQCARYQMSIIPGTNAFVVMINETCELRMSAFCPCSITDRLCLNCQRMEQSECECPCECPLTSDLCTGKLDPAEVSHDGCNLFTESDVLFKLPKTISNVLDQCLEPVCGRYKSKQLCMGLVGCSWCEKRTDGVTDLDRGYCDILQVCFGGVLGARTPYDDQITVSAAPDTHNTLLKNAPVGPVTGAILCVVLIVVLGIYCYRHNIHRRSPPGSDLPDSSNCSGGYNQDTDGYMYHELPAIAGPSHPTAAHMNLADMDMPLPLPAHISPYHVNENYRPPRPVVTATESSDRGYSTMTAQEEAETASSTSCRDSLVSAKSKNSSTMPTIKLLTPLSKSTRHSSRHRVEDIECSKLLPADSNVNRMASVLPQTIEEQPECERSLVT